MKRKIFAVVVVFAITAAIAFNVSLSKQNKGMSDVLLANVEALADDENCNGYKVKTIYTEQCEDIFIFHLDKYHDRKNTDVYKDTYCKGTGSQCCVPDSELISSTSEEVACTGDHG